jgi:hypothetical protein
LKPVSVTVTGAPGVGAVALVKLRSVPSSMRTRTS